jgi:hypothetical protein
MEEPFEALRIRLSPRIGLCSDRRDSAACLLPARCLGRDPRSGGLRVGLRSAFARCSADRHRAVEPRDDIAALDAILLNISSTVAADFRRDHVIASACPAHAPVTSGLQLTGTGRRNRSTFSSVCQISLGAISASATLDSSSRLPDSRLPDSRLPGSRLADSGSPTLRLPDSSTPRLPRQHRLRPSGGAAPTWPSRPLEYPRDGRS